MVGRVGTHGVVHPDLRGVEERKEGGEEEEKRGHGSWVGRRMVFILVKVYNFQGSKISVQLVFGINLMIRRPSKTIHIN